MKIPTETSPYTLMQEEFRNQPWKLLVGCILLNQVSAKVAKPVWQEFFEKYPTPESLMVPFPVNAEVEMANLFRPLGFQNRRAHRVWAMTCQFLMWDGVNPLTLYGVGKYAADSYNMFIKGEIVHDVQDKELKHYVEWASTQTHGPKGREAEDCHRRGGFRQGCPGGAAASGTSGQATSDGGQAQVRTDQDQD